MKKLIFSGSSDDLFEVEGDFTDETGCYDKPGIFKVTDKSGDGLYVVALYAPEGINAPVWAIGMAPLDEDTPLPNWQAYCRLADNGYSSALTIEAPDDVEVKAVGSAEE